MLRLIHYSLDPFSRSIRLALAECGLVVELEDERPWAWRRDFLMLNPAGTLPVLAQRQGFVLAGAYAISEYLGDTHGKLNGEGPPRNLMFPGTAIERAEVRRLVDWFHVKMDQEASRYFLEERLYQRFSDFGRNTPDTDIIKAGRANLRYHLSYVSHLLEKRPWLAGDELSFADLAAAGHFSVLDYLGEVPWEEFPRAKTWYTVLKARPSFRPLLADRLPGVPPPEIYAELDF
ncbi:MULTISPECIES: glutathione S-transferase family protein [Rhodomicrobium]|uniref:glutathione S-transferase family protein n=1 Tax=Rhodomicrobium TaxID=1068 RepID=UPI000B4ADB1A|nr:MULTISPECIES: glutathione S-transferase family protein [Rhodomicrobium]